MDGGFLPYYLPGTPLEKERQTVALRTNRATACRVRVEKQAGIGYLDACFALFRNLWLSDAFFAAQESRINGSPPPMGMSASDTE